MKHKIDIYEKGNGLVVTISVVATILAILGAAVSYTGHISRVAQRTRRIALAVEIADGHLEYLFTSWRNIYRNTWTTYGYASGGTDYSVVGTNYFYTNLYNPSNGCSGCATPTPVPYMTPSATPPTIPLPPASYFPTEANYTVSQYRIQAVDPPGSKPRKQDKRDDARGGEQSAFEIEFEGPGRFKLYQQKSDNKRCDETERN